MSLICIVSYWCRDAVGWLLMDFIFVTYSVTVIIVIVIYIAGHKTCF